MKVHQILLLAMCCSVMVGQGSSDVLRIHDLEDDELRAVKSCFLETTRLTGANWVYMEAPVNLKINRLMFIESPSGEFLKLELDIYPPIFDGPSFTCGMNIKDFSVIYASYVRGADVENHVLSQALADRLDDGFRQSTGATKEKMYLAKSRHALKRRIAQLKD